MYDDTAIRDEVLNSVPPPTVSEVQSQSESTTTATERSENVVPSVETTFVPDEQETLESVLSGESAATGEDS